MKVHSTACCPTLHHKYTCLFFRVKSSCKLLFGTFSPLSEFLLSSRQPQHDAEAKGDLHSSSGAKSPNHLKNSSKKSFLKHQFRVRCCRCRPEPDRARLTSAVAGASSSGPR